MTISAGRMQGVEVYTRSGKSIGRVSDVMLDESKGNVECVIIASGGFLGVGEKRYSMPWKDLRFDQANGNYIAAYHPQEVDPQKPAWPGSVRSA